MKVGVLWEGFGGLALWACVGEIVHHGFGKPLLQAIVPDYPAGVLQSGLIRADGRAFVGGIGLADVAGGRGAHGVGDAKADQLCTPGRNALCQHAAIHLADMAADGVDLIDISAGFEKDVCCVNLILQRDAGNGAAHQGRAAAGDH